MKLLSVLGNTYYLPCVYEGVFGKQCLQSSYTRFIQRALADVLLQLPDKLDTVVVFLTEEARRKNWQRDAENNYPGLEAELAELTEQEKITVRTVDIPEGKNEEELWDIFQKVADSIDEDDTVVFDITHAFRYIPLMAVLVAHYIRVVKPRVKVQGIYYGNIEAVGGTKVLQEKAKKGERVIAPITDLTAFVALQDWISHVNLFFETGRADLLRDQALHNAYLRLLGQEQQRTLREAMNSLHNLMQALYISNAVKVREHAEKTRESLLSLQGEIARFPAPYKPLVASLERLDEVVNEIVREDWVETALNAIRWCRTKRLYQQAFTMARELMVDLLYAGLSRRADPPNKQAQTYELREFLSWCAVELHDTKETDVQLASRLQSEWERRRRAQENRGRRLPPFELKDQAVGFVRSKGRALLHAYAEKEKGIRATRNTMNHAGDSAISREELEKRLQTFEQAARAFWKEMISIF